MVPTTEALWLERLAEFDRDALWALDGQLSCVSWLVWKLRMARSTAFEQLRVAHELIRRPVVAAAFREGGLSYSEVRLITRIERPDPEVDKALVDLAASSGSTITDLERVVRSYNLYADQDRPPTDDRRPPRDVMIRRGEDGTGQVVATLGDLELEEFAAAFQAFLDLRHRTGPVDESPAGDFVAEAPLDAPTHNETRVDALMDMVRTALLQPEDGQAVADDRYLVHLVTRHRRSARFLDGRPLDPIDAAMVGCDASTVEHTLDEEGDLLRLGRKTRDWNTAQRRAISVRDGGHCRFPGCWFRLYDIHHTQPWADGGLTDIDNGMCCCRRHHRLLHQGYRVDGDAGRHLRFYRPDGSMIGETYARDPVSVP